jgi:hypothetical protein
MCSVRGWPALTGPSTFPGSSSVFEQPLVKIQASQRQSYSMVVLFFCPVNFYMPPSRPPAHSSASCSLPFPAWQTARVVLRPQHRRLWPCVQPPSSTCSCLHSRRVCPPLTAGHTASGFLASSSSSWTSAAHRWRCQLTASSHILGSPRPLWLWPLAVAGHLCYVGTDPLSPLLSYEAGGGYCGGRQRGSEYQGNPPVQSVKYVRCFDDCGAKYI